MKCRNTTLYRVVHRVNGERRPKSFGSLADAKADAKNLKEIYTQGDSKIHLAADEKLDWQAAMNVLKRAGMRSAEIERIGSDNSEMALHGTAFPAGKGQDAPGFRRAPSQSKDAW